jgi:hypothetical protein
MAIEQPRYAVLQRDGNFELRRYEPYIVAEIEVSASFEEAGNVAFRPLAAYIFGENRGSEKMEMTAPVTQTPRGEKIGMTAPVIQSTAASGVYMVSFVMPSRYTMATLPLPMDERIHFREVPSTLAAAWTYRGGWSQARYAKEEKALRAALVKAKRTALGPAVWARYNAPYWPWFMRRNEILVEVRP